MAKRIARSVYRYRGHELRRQGEGWGISGPVLIGEAGTLVRAMRMIDRTPGVQPLADPSTAGRLGALAMHARYRMVPYGTSDFALVDRVTGKMVNTISGFNPFKKR
jgi:hypothetical protein